MPDQRAPRPPLPDFAAEHRTISTPIPPIIKAAALVLLAVVMTPVLMHIAWWVTPSTPFALLVIDKTSTNAHGLERAALFWILKHRKLTKMNGTLYDAGIDYRGFYPLFDTTYIITGLEQMGDDEVDSLAVLLGGVYVADTYGISAEEWNTKIPDGDPSRRLYGGLARQDLRLLTHLRNAGKPVLAEFNLIGSPTSDSVRNAAQELLGIRWTGWTGRYFATLDTINDREFPKWILRSYEGQYRRPWAYRESGVIMVHADGRVIVLEEETYLADPMPQIVTEKPLADYYGVAQRVAYPFWFDVTLPDERNGVVSKFVIDTNAYGDSLLALHGLRREFPALIHAIHPPVFYYFCMDAADNPVPGDFFAGFRGIEWLDWLFHDANNPVDRRRFFWNYYFPVMSQILEEVTQHAFPGNSALPSP